jgi:hypothetical protein
VFGHCQASDVALMLESMSSFMIAKSLNAALRMTLE